MISKEIYCDEFYRVVPCPEYPSVPGFYVIFERDKPWYSSINSIKRLAILEKTIRDELLLLGTELVGIYHEEIEEKFRVLIIPYYVQKLRENGISPDLYQPFITKYLNSFVEFNLSLINDINNKISNKLERIKEEL